MASNFFNIVVVSNNYYYLLKPSSSILAADVIIQHHKQLTGISLYYLIIKCTNAKSANSVSLNNKGYMYVCVSALSSISLLVDISCPKLPPLGGELIASDFTIGVAFLYLCLASQYLFGVLACGVCAVSVYSYVLKIWLIHASDLHLPTGCQRIVIVMNAD